MNQMTID